MSAPLLKIYSMIHYEVATKKDTLESLAMLRIEVFRAFPYLYEGSLAYEKEYLKTYTENPEARIFLAYDDDKIIGASSCIPMDGESDELKKPLLAAGINIHEVLYFGESVLKSEYRGKGIGVEFFNLREAHARDLGLKNCMFCAVVRPENHPLRPPHYQDLSLFWENRGFHKTLITSSMNWLDIGETKPTDKVMEFWSN